jgi:hypothetical protein
MRNRANHKPYRDAKSRPPLEMAPFKPHKMETNVPLQPHVSRKEIECN